MFTKMPSAIGGAATKAIEQPVEPIANPAGTLPSVEPGRRHWFKLILLAFLAFAVVCAIYRVRSASGALPEGLIQANGRIEGDTIIVGSKFPGRIEKVFVREGDQVVRGQVMAQLQDDQARAKVAQARQALIAAESQLNAAKSALETARKEVPLSVEAATAAVARAQSNQEKAKTAEEQALRDAQRFKRLADKGSVGKQRAEQAELASTTAGHELESAGTGLDEARQQLSLAKLGWDRIRSKEGELQALLAQAGEAQAALDEAESILKDLTIRSPSTGIVTNKIGDVGEIVSAGSPLYEIVDLDKLYLKVYVPENQIGKLRLLAPAQVFTDAYPDQPVTATTRYISSRAEFTPKEVQTADERVKLVFAVKLYLDANPEHRLTPGMSADAVIRSKEGIPWAKPRS